MKLETKYFFDTLVIGTGAAGLNAADWLADLGCEVAILTEGMKMGTSRNTGSDKQTYYKLSLATGEADSVQEMARTLFEGGATHGDTALIEAAGSVKAFMKLVLLGVPFPTNTYGEYVGYKTDHDPRQRATSCGPYTSKLMTEALERSVLKKSIPIFDHNQVVRILMEDNIITGVIAIDTVNGAYTAFACNNVILATGGPAAIYRDAVYPPSQTGALGLAINAGADMVNLCEWQYGLASMQFRWNASGTYQQVLPRYTSMDSDGKEREFLADYFASPLEALNMVFLKGYEWPFDVRKLAASARVDMAVHEEMKQGRRVFLDFRENPAGLEGGFDKLADEAYQYLRLSDATFGTPIERLLKMNPQAYQLYKDNGIDLKTEALEIAVCAQHMNGGVAVDENWESSVSGLYAVGEAAGTFGLYRPGGSALNSTQVGAMRAAEHIAGKEKAPCRPFSVEVEDVAGMGRDFKEVAAFLERSQGMMSADAAFRRDTARMRVLYGEIRTMLDGFWAGAAATEQKELPRLHKCHDTLCSQAAVLSAMLFAAEKYGSRGGALVEGAKEPGDVVADTVVITRDYVSHEEKVRPLPAGGGWFETVWGDYNRRK